MKSPTTNRLDRAAFGRRLTQIRAEGQARREQSRIERTTSEVLRSQKLMGAFEFLDDVEELAVECLDQMASELPGSPKVARSVFDGRYMIVMRLEEDLADADGRRGRYFSRLAFLLEPRHESDSFTIEVRATVRGRDIEGDLLTVAMGDQGAVERLQALIETRALAFAQRYFESTGFTRLASHEAPAAESEAWLDDSYGT